MSNVPVVGGVGLSQTRQPELYAATITTYCLALLALGLRFLSRRLLKSGHGLDDWFAVAAMVRCLVLARRKPDADRGPSSQQRDSWLALSRVIHT